MPRIIGRVNVEELTGFWQKEDVSSGAHVVVAAAEEEEVVVESRAMTTAGPETSTSTSGAIFRSSCMCQLRASCVGDL
jgi:hypothetical protein